jgi:NADPH:quinone reductase-like Zn-dependent oxidoreductase
VTIDYRHQDFVDVVREATADRPGGPGADVVLDNMGAAYLTRNLEVLATSGRLVVLGMQGGRRAELDLGLLMRKRAAIAATTLRARPATEKAAICAAVEEHVWPLVADGVVRPVVHARIPVAEVQRAHETLEDGAHVGKVLITIAG